MIEQIYALQAEILKNKHSSILWATFLSFGLAPIIGGVFILILKMRMP
jgi:ABC-2 type transport system permease protein